MRRIGGATFEPDIRGDSRANVDALFARRRPAPRALNLPDAGPGRPRAGLRHIHRPRAGDRVRAALDAAASAGRRDDTARTRSCSAARRGAFLRESAVRARGVLPRAAAMGCRHADALALSAAVPAPRVRAQSASRSRPSDSPASGRAGLPRLLRDPVHGGSAARRAMTNSATTSPADQVLLDDPLEHGRRAAADTRRLPGYTTAIGPCMQTCRQFALVR